MFDWLKRRKKEKKEIRVGKFKDPAFSHLAVIEVPKGTTDEEMQELLAKQGITLNRREATPEDLVEGLPEPQRTELLNKLQAQRK